MLEDTVCCWWCRFPERQHRKQPRQLGKRKWPEMHAMLREKLGKDWWAPASYPSEHNIACFPGLAALTDRDLDSLALFDTAFPDSPGT